MGKQSARRRKSQAALESHGAAGPAAATEEDAETMDYEDAAAAARRKQQKILTRPVPVHVLVGVDDGDGDGGSGSNSDGLCLSLVQTLIDRRVKLMRATRRSGQRSFVVISTASVAKSLALPGDDDGSPRVTVAKLGNTQGKDWMWGDDDDDDDDGSDNNNINDYRGRCRSGSSFHVSLLRRLSAVMQQQLSGTLEKRLHGIFIHCRLGGGGTIGSTSGIGSAGVPALRAMLQSMFMDEQLGVSRLDLQGVICVVRPMHAPFLDRTLCALVDRFVLATRVARTSAADQTVSPADDPQVVKDALRLLAKRNRRAESVCATLSGSSESLLTLSPDAAQNCDEIFAYSRYVVTQVFPDDNDLRKVRPTPLQSIDPVTPGTGPAGGPAEIQDITICLRNHASVDLDKIQFWLTSFLAKNGHRCLRLKALLAVRGSRQKYVLQGCSASFGIEPSSEQFWNQSRRCTFLFVGWGLDAGTLHRELSQCIARQGPVEQCYWWTDAHCCIVVLMMVLLSLVSGMGTLFAFDMGWITLSSLSASWSM